jgi:ABC-2 type transport system permease protein
MNNIKLIASREYSVRVKKRSFIIATLLMPLFMIVMMVAPSLIMMTGKSETKHIVVVDDSPEKIVGRSLQSNASIEYELLENVSKSQACIDYNDESKASAILYIGSNITENPNNIQLFTNGSSSITTEENIKSEIERILSHEKIISFKIDNIEKILAEADVRISAIQTLKNNGSGDDDSMEKTSSNASFILALILGMLLYMIIIIYGQMVLATVIEEKQSRVIDVLITSCKPFDIMMGKIIGIVCVAATQLAIWAVILICAGQFLLPAIFSTDIIGGDMAMISSVLSTFTNIGYIVKLFFLLLIYIVGGFLLYASMFAAAGSSVDSAQDASQFSIIIMMPIIFSILIMMQVFNDPNSSSMFWFSIIPFTSPVVMMARIPFDVPTWQIILSAVILYITFIVMTWVAAKIYRIGIMTHGKKPSWKELGQWITQK